MLTETPFGLQDEGELKTLTCYTDSSNPPVNIKWTSDNLEIITKTEHGSGEYGGRTSTSLLTVSLTKSWNGKLITWGTFREADDVVIEYVSISLDVKCMYKYKYIYLYIIFFMFAHHGSSV